MKTLLERLKPEYLELLEADAEKYPYLVQGIKNELNKCFFFVDITFETAYRICTCSKVNLGVTELHSLFNKE